MNIIILLSRNKQGAAALYIVVILTVIALLMAKSAVLIGVDQLEIANIASGRQELEYIAESCAEDMLLRMRMGLINGVDNEILPRGGATCIINIENNGEESVVNIVVNKSNKRKRLLVKTVGIGNQLEINKWEFVKNQE